jgi:putative peptidoglycan lipid II flippase
VLLAGVLHVWMHLRAAKQAAGGERFRFQPDLRAPEVRKVALLMAPALIGTGLIQFNILLDTVWAGFLGPVALASLYFSQRIIYLPVGLFGVASSVVSLPAMSQSWARDDRQEFCGQLAHSLRSVLFMCLPMTALLIVLSEPIVRLVFQRGSFGESSVDATLWALLFYLPGIPFFSLVKPMANGFYARKNTFTPVLVTVACLLLNVCINLLVIAPHAWPDSVFSMKALAPLLQGGLALSTTLCSMLNLLLLGMIFRRQTGLRVFHEVGPAFGKILAATGVGALAAMLVLNGTQVMVRGNGPLLVQRLFTVLVPLIAGYGAYVAAAWLMGCEELKELAALVFAKLRRKRE